MIQKRKKAERVILYYNETEIKKFNKKADELCKQNYQLIHSNPFEKLD